MCRPGMRRHACLQQEAQDAGCLNAVGSFACAFRMLFRLVTDLMIGTCLRLSHGGMMNCCSHDPSQQLYVAELVLTGAIRTALSLKQLPWITIHT